MHKGSDAAKKARKSYSQVVATKSTNNTKIKNNIVKNNVTVKRQLPNQIGTGQDSGLYTNSQPNPAVPSNGSSPDTMQNTAKKNTKFLRGTASTPSRSLAGELPDHFKNKVIVISPVSKKFNQNQVKQEINRIAGKIIDYKSEIIILNKTYQDTRTIAIELNDEDYRLLSNKSIWNSNMRISEFKGRRFWRQNNMRLTISERKNAVKDSWNH